MDVVTPYAEVVVDLLLQTPHDTRAGHVGEQCPQLPLDEDAAGEAAGQIAVLVSARFLPTPGSGSGMSLFIPE